LIDKEQESKRFLLFLVNLAFIRKSEYYLPASRIAISEIVVKQVTVNLVHFKNA